MSILIALIIWSALIAGIVEGIKAISKATGYRDCPALVRSLPVWPFALGAISGAWVLPAAASQMSMPHFAALPVGVYIALGFGAGAVAGQSWKIVNQTLKGADFRLQK